MNRLCGATLLLFVMASIAEGQLAGTLHVFPQIADGKFVDGTFYRSTFIVSNVTSTAGASCTIQVYGLSADRLSSSAFTLPLGAIVRVATSGLQTFASGYATLSCSQPVKAVLIYRYLSSASATLGMATVFPSPPTTNAYFLPTMNDRLAIAVANDTDNVQHYDLAARDSAGATVATGSLTIQPRSNSARFADELLVVPAGYSGPVYINAPAGSAAFSTIGLIFSGAIFTTLPPFSAVP